MSYSHWGLLLLFLGGSVSPVPGGGAGASDSGQRLPQGLPHEAMGHQPSARQVQVLVLFFFLLLPRPSLWVACILEGDGLRCCG